MKKSIIVITAVASAAAAVSGIITGVIVNRRNHKRYDRLEDDYINLMEECTKVMEDFTDYICDKNGWDREDYIFEEDNEDE